MLRIMLNVGQVKCVRLFLVSPPHTDDRELKTVNFHSLSTNDLTKLYKYQLFKDLKFGLDIARKNVLQV